jgi:transmembrane sensor
MNAFGGTNRPVDDVAAEWFARVRSGSMSTAERNDLAIWRASNAAHEAAYGDFEKAWSVMGTAAGHEAVRAMRAIALSGIAPEKHPYWRYWGLAAAITLAIGALFAWRSLSEKGYPLLIANGSPLYSTDVGERSTVALEDGSTVVLNTQTRLRVALTGTTREVILLRGQALFDVAEDERRPFIVHAGNRRIVALGTAFDVRVEANDVRVTLVSGRVAVDEVRVGESKKSLRRAELAPGQQLLASNGQADAVRPTDIRRVTSWRDGRLVFENEPLANVVAEVNRYSHRQVVLAESSLGELRVSGTFRTGSPTNFIAALREYFPIEAREEDTASDFVLTWRSPG